MAAAQIIEAARDGARVAFIEEGEFFNGDGIVWGTARHIVKDEGGGFAHTEPVEECLLRVTTKDGWEAFWPMAMLIEKFQRGMFCVNVAFPSTVIGRP